MKWIAIAIMSMMLTKAKNDRDKQTDTTIIKAYNVLVQNYEYTIMFLKSQQNFVIPILKHIFVLMIGDVLNVIKNLKHYEKLN